jgi:hypothetical protein
MLGRHALITVALIAAWTPVAVQPVKAQCRLCGAPTTVRDNLTESSAVKLEVEATLDFDQLILLASGDGTATLSPDGSRSTSGSIAGIAGRAMVGSVSVQGEPGRPVSVELPERIELYSIGGGRLTIDNIASDLPSAPKLDSAGRITFRFGGRLRVSGDAEGDYSGDVPITVEYL